MTATTRRTPPKNGVLGKAITIEKLQRLLGDKAIERLEVAALRDEALKIVPATAEDFDGAARFIEGFSPKALSKNAPRHRYRDRNTFTRVSMKYLAEHPQARTAFVTWCRESEKAAKKETKK